MEDAVYIPVETMVEWERQRLKKAYPHLRPEFLEEVDMKRWYKEHTEPKKLEPVYDDEGICFGYM